MRLPSERRLGPIRSFVRLSMRNGMWSSTSIAVATRTRSAACRGFSVSSLARFMSLNASSSRRRRVAGLSNCRSRSRFFRLMAA